MNTELISLATSCPDKPEYNKETFPILVTSEAINKLIDANKEEQKLIRVSVLGGGCSGYMYDLDFVQESKENDLKREFTQKDSVVTLIVDPKSAYILEGTTIDYVSSKLGSSGFKFLAGNKVKRTCGCGESFNV